MLHFTVSDLDRMSRGFRVNFVNSLSGFKSMNMIGTCDSQGNENVAVFSSVVHLGADPALIGLVSRPRSVERHSIDNLLETGHYTINHVNEKILKMAHQTSARYPKEVSEFEATGLTPAFVEGFPAPVVKEANLSILMKFIEAKPIEINDTEFIIGEVQAVLLRDEVVADDGYIDIEALQTVAVTGLDCYHRTDRIGRLTYAKPDKKPGWF